MIKNLNYLIYFSLSLVNNILIIKNVMEILVEEVILCIKFILNVINVKFFLKVKLFILNYNLILMIWINFFVEDMILRLKLEKLFMFFRRNLKKFLYINYVYFLEFNLINFVYE